MKQLFLLIFLVPITLFSQKNNFEEIDSTSYYNNLVAFYNRENKYKFGLLNSEKAIAFANKTGNKLKIAQSYSRLGLTYLELKKYDAAIDTFLKSIANYSTQSESESEAYTYYSLGLCYIKNNNFLTAEDYLDKSKTIYQNLNIVNNNQMIDLQKGIVYREKGLINEATLIFSKLISDKENDNNLLVKANALHQLGLIEETKNNTSLALNYFQKAYNLSDEKLFLEEKSKAALALSRQYEKVSNYKESNFYLKINSKLKDDLSKIFSKKLFFEDYDLLVENEKFKAYLSNQKNSKEAKKTASFTKLINILAIALISILSLLSLSLYKNNKIRKNSNFLLNEKNNELEKEKEKAEKATKSRSEFLSTVSHELRTPLNAINGITHLLITENPRKNQVEYLDSLKFSGDYLLTFINDILEINRIESDKIEVEKININLRILLHKIHISLKELAQENNNNLLLEIDSNLPENIISDPIKLSQIFMNLTNNSLKFTKNGFVKMQVKVIDLQEKDITVQFVVSDNGIGIPEEKHNSIFDSFAQGSIEINRKYGGTGLGLAIVKKLVELLGGKIFMNSKVGLGTTFSFSLQFEIGDTVESVVANYDLSNLENKNILLVEDNKINQMITKKILQKKGIECSIAESGEEAIHIMKAENSFDMILMDVHLPGINGNFAAEKIRKFNKTIPIIALTAISLNENRDMLMSYGMNDVVTKPFDPENLYKIISKMI